MNIAFITPEYITEMNYDGGLANYISKISKLLKKSGNFVRIYVVSTANGVIVDHGIEIVRIKIPSFFAIFKVFPFNIIKKSLGNLILAFIFTTRIIHDNSKYKYDVIQIPSYCYLGIWLSLIFRKKVVLRVSSISTLWRRYGNNVPSIDDILFEFLEILNLRFTKNIIVPSTLIHNILLKQYKIRSKILVTTHIKTNSNCDIKPKSFCSKSVLYFGTLSHLKGVDYLINNIDTILTDSNVDTLILIGKNKLPYKLHGYSDKKIVYLPSMHQENLIQYINEAKFIIIPSRIDNLPNTCLEAMSLGKIVLASYQSGLNQVIENSSNGYLFDLDDMNSLVKSLKSIRNLSLKEYLSIEQKAELTIVNSYGVNSFNDYYSYLTSLNMV